MTTLIISTPAGVDDAVRTAIEALIGNTPGALDTLDELAAALGDDASFATTITLALSNRVRIDTEQSMTTTEQATARTNINAESPGGAQSKADDAEQNAKDASTPVAHVTDFENPHEVTKAQVGLGEADNTSDEDKPISIAVQAALDGAVRQAHLSAVALAMAI